MDPMQYTDNNKERFDSTITSIYEREAFVFFSPADADWAHKVLIPALGLPPAQIITRDQVQLGAAKISALEQAVQTSRFVLFVVGSDEREDWSSYVEVLAKTSDVEQYGRGRIIPINRGGAPLPFGLRIRNSLDFSSADRYEEGFAQLRALFGTQPPLCAPPPCPYPGLVPYDTKFAEQFFGRERESAKLAALLRHRDRIMVLGPSGSGKSSFVMASVLPAASRGGWRPIVTRPGAAPLVNLNQMLNGLSGQNEWRDKSAPRWGAAKLLLVIDQFEELFAVADREEQHEYARALNALRQREGYTLILALRADFYAELMESELWPVRDGERVDIAPLRGDQLREAIRRPALNCDVVIEPALVDRLIVDTAQEPGVLPLLQETMVRLWNEVRHNFLPLRAYEALASEGRNGLATAISVWADTVLDRLSDEQQAIARRILLRLVQPGHGRPDTRRQRTVSELRSAQDDPFAFEQTLEALSQGRLITVDRGVDGAIRLPSSGQDLVGEAADRRRHSRLVDLAHEALITSWDTLQKWVATYREAQAVQHRLEGKAAEWLRLNRGGGLLDRVELAEAEHWLADPAAEEIGYSDALATLVNESRAKIEDSERRETERLRALAEAALERARVEEARAEEQRRLRLRSTALAIASHLQRGIEIRDRSLLLARQAYRLDQISGGGVADQTDAALRATLELPDTQIALRGHRCAVNCLAFSSRGYLASADDGGDVYLWNISRLDAVGVAAPNASPQPVLVPRPAESRAETRASGVHSLAFNQSGEILAVLDRADDVTLFKIRSEGIVNYGKKHLPLDTDVVRDNSGARHLVAFDPEGNVISDGDELLPLSARRLIRDRGLTVGTSTGRAGSHIWCRFAAAPDRRHLCIGNPYPGSSSTELWKIDGAEPWRHRLPGRELGRVTYSGDGQRLFATVHGRLRAWKLDWPITPLPMRLGRRGGYRNGISIGISAIAADHDGRTVACGFQDGEIWITRESRDSTWRTLTVLPDDFIASALAPDGSLIAVWRKSREACVQSLWDSNKSAATQPPVPDAVVLENDEEEVRGAAYFAWQAAGSPAGRDQEFWRAAESKTKVQNARRAIVGRNGNAGLLARLADGNWGVATWEQAAPANAMLAKIAKSSVYAAALGIARNDEVFVAVQSYPNFQLYRACDLTNAIWTIQYDGNPPLWLAFDCDCNLIAGQQARHDFDREVGSAVRVWDARRGAVLLDLPATPSRGSCATFSTDSRLLAVGLIERRAVDSDDADLDLIVDHEAIRFAAAVYDLTEPLDSPTLLSGPKGDATALAFSHDGGHLAIGGTSGDIAVVRLGAPLAIPLILRGHSSPILALAFDGSSRLVSVAADGAVRGWLADTRALADAVCARVSRNLTEQEWAHFIGTDIPYEATCPGLPAGRSSDAAQH
jgi:WD40 repeat protein